MEKCGVYALTFLDALKEAKRRGYEYVYIFGNYDIDEYIKELEEDAGNYPDNATYVIIGDYIIDLSMAWGKAEGVYTLSC